MAVSGEALDFAESPEPEASESSPTTSQDEPGSSLGPWLDEPKDKVFAQIEAEVKRQEPAAKNFYERCKRNDYWRDGKPFARLIEKREDKGVLEAWLPPTSRRQAPLPNKTDDLCNKIEAQIAVDPPVPDVTPATGSDEDRDGAEFATRWLKSDGGESGTNDLQTLRTALGIACTHASAYVHYYTDPAGGGWRPLEIEAHPTSQTVEDALLKPGPVDPLTGMPGQPVKTTDGLVKRYVRPDETLTDEPIEADREWLPKIKKEVLKPAHVRLLPDTAADLWDADGVILLRYCSLDDFIAMYPDVESYGDEELHELVNWRPHGSDVTKRILPKHVKDEKPDTGRTVFGGKTSTGGEERPKGSALVFYYLAYQHERPLYPEGAMVVASAGTVHHRQPMSAEVKRRDGKVEKMCLEPPLTQYRSLNDPLEGNPHGKAIIERFGPGNEYRAAIMTAVLENIDQILHRHVFLPITSPVRPRQLATRDGTPIRIGSPEDKPTFEDPATIPDWAGQIIDRIDQDMDSASGLQETAQGLETPRSVSGVAKRTAVEQSLVALGQMFQNALIGLQRGWRIKLQLARADFRTPHLIGYVGEDGAYKHEQFSSIDLSGAKDVQIAKGTGTMMSPAAKQEWLAGLQQYQWISPMDAGEAIRGGIAGLLGVQDNPHLMRARRALVEWRKGPPEGWLPPQPVMAPAVDPMTGQPIVDPMTGQPQMQPQVDEMGQPVMGPPSYNPFEPRVNDEEPEVAAIRVRELSRALASSSYTKHVPEWRQLMDAEYERMRFAAGIQTVRELQQAQQQQALAAEEAANADRAAGESERGEAAAEKQKDRDAKKDEQTSSQQFELARESIRAQSGSK